METCCGQRAGNQQLTAATIKQDHTWRWSGKKMEGVGGLNTLECLRGRLLAERQASKVAKEEAESMGNKFIELEKKVREEIKLRGKAERKLKILRKKLESFNLISPSGQSYWSEKCEKSGGSSSCCTTSTHSEANETKHQTVNQALLENAVHNHSVAEASLLIQNLNDQSTTKDCDSQLNDISSCNSEPSCSFPQISSKTPNQSSQNLKNDENRLPRSSSKSLAKGYNSQGTDDYSSNPSILTHATPENICHNPNPRYEGFMNDESRHEDDHGDFIDNSMALVPVTFPATQQVTCNHKLVNDNVLEALDALRHARERLQSQLGTRSMINVGPT